MNRFLFATAALVILVGCQPEAEEGWAPVARFSVEPLYVPSGVSTQITLDARRSCDALDSPELCDNSEDGDGTPTVCPGGIEYSWDIPGQVGSVTPLKPSYSLINANVSITSPVKITLTVTDCDGMSSSKSTMLGVSAP